ncbi:VOC family protein [Pokkaliibacter sp. CJK22405]|uniref:2-oxoadipate dioxygenase/decarboxylase HglS n=1 Tax=Pokkaliibacter sp. CJK22405 TaxID=3384615 RepID=UPI003984874D
MSTPFLNPDLIRARFSQAMSEMYRNEVPLYGTLLGLVAEVNQATLQSSPELKAQLENTGEMERLDAERHGAIRVGTPQELATIARLFAVMGMEPVGYYDLAPAGVPVHSTAFRAVHESSLQVSPFRVFTSLLRMELIEDKELRAFAEATLNKRSIFTQRALELIEQAEQDGGLSEEDADTFVTEALETFRWHHSATVSLADYQRLLNQHRLIADVVAFKGPHINHLTPRTLDIDSIQAGMPRHDITPKAVIEGPPRRHCPILLRQTSFKALNEAIEFTGEEAGSHSARFGEIEQRGVALTPKGRALYDDLLNKARDTLGAFPNESNAADYMSILEETFTAFPDDYTTLREQELAYFRYVITDKSASANTLEEALSKGVIVVEPLVYEDFLPVSAAGIFQSNLGDDAQSHYQADANRDQFEKELGRKTLDELALYADTQSRSLAHCKEVLGF